MKLYHHPLSTYSQKVLIALYEKAVDFEPVIVDLFDAEARRRYREIYPMGKIPLLELDDGHLIPESSIIIEYLDGLGGPRLIPEDPERARKTRFKDRMFDLYLNNPVVTLFFQNLKPEAERDAERIETARFQIATMYGFMDKEFTTQSWANGDEFSFSDCSAAPALGYAPMVAPFDDRPPIVAYWQRLSARPSFSRVREQALPYLEAFNRQHAA